MAVIRLADHRPPIVYTITISHHWDNSLEVWVRDVGDDPRSIAAVKEAVRRWLDSTDSTP